jgi:hypothetical protein
LSFVGRSPGAATTGDGAGHLRAGAVQRAGLHVGAVAIHLGERRGPDPAHAGAVRVAVVEGAPGAMPPVDLRGGRGAHGPGGAVTAEAVLSNEQSEEGGDPRDRGVSVGGEPGGVPAIVSSKLTGEGQGVFCGERCGTRRC